MTKQYLAIIGNGMATGRLLDELARRDGFAMFDVSVFGEEPHGAYNRILLNRVLEGGGVDEITLKPVEWYAAQGVHFFPGKTVAKVSDVDHRLWTTEGNEHYFDVVVFATGSLPRVPQVEGIRRADGKLKEGVFAYRTVLDVERMRAHSRPEMRAVVVGGGLLGLEAAKGLVDLGLRTTVVHNADILMNRQVDRLGGMYLRLAIEQLGIEVKTGVKTRAVVGEDRVEAVEFEGGDRLPAEMVVFASGIVARVDLAQASGVPVKAGIVVDDRMETKQPGVFAVGECAEHDGQVYGTVQPIYEQCAVLADILTGANPDARYRGTKVYTKLKVAGIEVASMGSIHADQPGDEVVQVIEERRSAYRKLILRGGRLAGAVLVGDSSSAAALIRMLDNGTPLPTNRLDLLASGDISSSANNDPEVCNCHHVTRSRLVDEIRGGCDSLARLSARTDAGTGCGSCRGQLADLILKNAPVEAGREKG